jgi:hypothetical protein
MGLTIIPGVRIADDFLHESRLAQACFRHDADDLAFAFHSLIQLVVDDFQLFNATHHWQGIVWLLQTDGALISFACDCKDR